MFENLAYVVIGFLPTFLVLEAAWHFTAGKIKDKTIEHSLYKQIGILRWRKDMRLTAARVQEEQAVHMYTLH